MEKAARVRKATAVFWLCWLVYAVAYIGRLNFSASLGDMTASGWITKAQGGIIGTGFFISYGAGQLVSGILGDLYKPRGMVMIGLVASALVNLAVSLQPAFPVMMALWCVNGLAQSLLWSPLLRFVAERMEGEPCTWACANLSTAGVVGNLLVYVLCAALIAFAHWRWSFLVAAVLLGLMAAGWWVAAPKLPERDNVAWGAAQRGNPLKGLSALLFLPLILLAAGAGVLNGALRDGVSMWVPTFLSDRTGVDTALAVLMTSLLPVLTLPGVALATFLNRKCRNEFQAMGLLFVLGTLAVVGLFFARHSILCVVLFAMVTMTMMAVNTITVSLIPLRFAAQGRLSTVSGYINAMTYVGSGLSSFIIGAVAQGAGWNAVLWVWLGMAAAGILLGVLGRKQKGVQA